MSLPRTAKFDQTVSLVWSSGQLFDGYILVALDPPTGYARVALANFQPEMRLPLAARVPIKGGRYSDVASLYFNADLVPPNSKYTARWYDATDTLVAGPSAQFTVSTDPFTPPTPTLTAPVAAASTFVPDTPV